MAENEKWCGAPLRGVWGRCERPATVVRDGNGYCWQHDPVRLKEKAVADREARKAEIARVEAEQDARIARRQLEGRCGLHDLSDEDLHLLASCGGVRPIIERARAAWRSREIRESGVPIPTGES